MMNLLGPELAKARTAELIGRAAGAGRGAHGSGRARRVVGRGLIRLGSWLTGAAAADRARVLTRRPA
jgi:hypothetical protein